MPAKTVTLDDVQPAEQSATPVTPTPASAWNNRGLYRLPSGNVAQLRRVGVLGLAAARGNHNPIADAVLLQLNVNVAAPTTDQERAALIRNNATAYLAVAQQALVSPRLVLDREPDYEAGEIGAGDLSDQDLLWINFDFQQGEAAYLATFRLA